MITFDEARRSASRVSACRALASFLAASLAAFSRAVTDSVDRFAFSASVRIPRELENGECLGRKRGTGPSEYN